MEQELALPGVEETNVQSHENKKLALVVILVLILSAVGAFAAGFGLRGFLQNEVTPPVVVPSLNPVPSNVQPSGVPTPSPRVIDQPAVTRSSSGRSYFNDTILLVTKDEPRHIVVATVARQEQGTGFVQNNRISYFDGEDWNREIESQSLESSKVEPFGSVRNWVSEIDSSRVLREQLYGELRLGNNEYRFETGMLENEIGIRSLPGYTKFASSGETILLVNGQERPAYEALIRIYSMDSAEIQFLNESLGIVTDWLVFWDEEGNFYHVDKTTVDRPTAIYGAHEFAAWVHPSNGVTKTFGVGVTRDTSLPPNGYLFNLSNPIDKQIEVELVNFESKDTSGTRDWFLGEVRGRVIGKDGLQVAGIGLVEYIRD